MQTVFSRKGVISANDFTDFKEKNNFDSHSALLALARQASRLAFPPVSDFFVGAAGLGESGCVYLGFNIEFFQCNLSCSIHAEQCVLNNAVQCQEKMLLAIAVTASPCGHCRQFMMELKNHDDIDIIFDNSPMSINKLRDLLPLSFTADLSKRSQPLLMDNFRHQLQYSKESETWVRQFLESNAHKGYLHCFEDTLNNCCTSYSPYSNCPASVTLITTEKYYCGHVIESGAHSPTLQPFQAAVATAFSHGLKDLNEVKTVILLELKDSIVQHGHNIQAILKGIKLSVKLITLYVQPF